MDHLRKFQLINSSQHGFNVYLTYCDIWSLSVRILGAIPVDVVYLDLKKPLIQRRTGDCWPR